MSPTTNPSNRHQHNHPTTICPLNNNSCIFSRLSRCVCRKIFMVFVRLSTRCHRNNRSPPSLSRARCGSHHQTTCCNIIRRGTIRRKAAAAAVACLRRNITASSSSSLLPARQFDETRSSTNSRHLIRITITDTPIFILYSRNVKNKNKNISAFARKEILRRRAVRLWSIWYLNYIIVDRFIIALLCPDLHPLVL